MRRLTSASVIVHSLLVVQNLSPCVEVATRPNATPERSVAE